jgi:hypothetical protein
MASANGASDPSDPTSWNHYAYTGGDPVNRTDPTGQLWALCSSFADDGDGAADCSVSIASEFFFPGQLAGGGGGGQKWDVSKSYPKTMPCNQTASQVMSQVENNFAQFGNFTTTGRLGISESVTFSPPSGALKVGESIPIAVIAGPTTLNTSVSVTAVSATSLSFATVPGHLLYPANITFSASDAGTGSIAFNISLQGDIPNLLNYMKFKLGGGDLEDAQWNNFEKLIGVLCNKKTAVR